MTGIPPDHYEDLIADELCAYQTLLDHGASSSGDSACGRTIPDELRSTLNDYRRCLDLLHATRRRVPRSPPGMDKARDAPVYTLPRRVGRFPIHGQLGMGGFGIVFLGFDSETNRKVAIKVPRAEFLENAELIERFRQEAASAARLDHPNILGIFESDFRAIPPYIVTPYIEGGSLAEWRPAESRTAAPKIAAEIVRQLAEGISHAHKKGVLHRDLKPGNVLLAPRESATGQDELPFVPKLTDFGLAKCADLASRHTRTGALLGTASYMAPEQAQGRRKEVNESTDIYGLGAILYELLTGAPPFRGESDLQTVQEIVRDEPRTPSSHNAQVPLDLDVICLKCLDKAPTSRYASARELADDLGRFLRSEPIRARRTSWTRRLGKWCRRHPTRAATLGAAMLGLFTLLTVSLWYNSRLSDQLEISEHERKTAQRERVTAEEQRQIASQQASEIRRRAYVSDMRMAKIAWDQSNVDQMLKLLDRHQPRAGEPDLRNFAWWYLWREYHEPSRLLAKTSDGPAAVAMTADGKLAASAGKEGVIRLWSLPAGTLQAELRGTDPAQVHSLDFSPGGAQLVSACDDGRIHIWDVSAGRELAAWRGHLNWVAQAAYAPAGEVIASAGADRMVHLWDPQTGAPLGTLSGHETGVRCLAFHPSEPVLATGGRDGTIRLWDLTELRPAARFRGGTIRMAVPEWPRAIAFAPDGNSLLVARRDSQPTGTIQQFDLRGENPGREDLRLPQPSEQKCLIGAHDGSVITGCTNSAICIADRPPGSGETVLHGHRESVESIAAPADCSCLVSGGADGEVRYWPDWQDRSSIRLPGATDDSSPNPNEEGWSRMQWSGRRLVAHCPGGKVAVFRMPERELERTFSHAGGFGLSPTGELLLLCGLSGATTCVRAADGRTLWTLQLPEGAGGRNVLQVIDSSETYAVVACENELLVVPFEKPAILHRLSHPKRINQLQLINGAEGLWAISACSDGGVRIWDVKSGKLLKHIPISAGAALSVAVSRDQRFIAAAHDRKVRVWRLDGLEQIGMISTNEISGLIALLEGADILAVTEHNKLILWSVRDELELLTFPINRRFTFAVSPDGRQLAVLAHRMVHIFDGTPRD